MHSLKQIACVLAIAATIGACRRKATVRPPEDATGEASAAVSQVEPEAATEVVDAHEGTAQPPVDPCPAEPGPGSVSFARVAVLGASVSAGFGVPGVAALLEDALPGEHRIENCADLFHFRDPAGRGRRQVDRARTFEPTVVFAVDFLFWYAYGAGWTLAEREAFLDIGLRELERLEVPVLVGDLPDMSGAGEWMLAPDQIPPPEELEALNRKLCEWARARPGVLLLPLRAWTAPLHAATPVVVASDRPPVAPAALMSLDGLHPNAEGMRYLLSRIDAAIESRFPATPPDAFIIAWPGP